MQPKLVIGARCVLGLLFLYAGYEKLAAPNDFAEAIDGYQLVPQAWAGWLALLIPSAEVVVGLSLVLGPGSRAAALLAGLMLLAFSFGIAQAMVRGINVECGCFGSATASQADYIALIRNAGLLSLSAFILLRPEAAWLRRDRVDADSGGRHSEADD